MPYWGRICTCILVLGVVTSGFSYALTPKEEKGVKVLKDPSLVYDSPTWFTPFSLEEAPEELAYWLQILPYDTAENTAMYVVMPTLWLITPVILIPEWSDDYENMSQWLEIDINKYLVDGVLHYPRTPMPGEEGNSVIFGHSNFYKDWLWDYKTIFADIMALDVSVRDEIWVYIKDLESTWYTLRKFSVDESYETVPTDVGILQPKWWKELTVFACTNWLEWRRILRGMLIEDDEIHISYPLKFRIWDIVEQLASKEPSRIDDILSESLTAIERIRISLDTVDETDHYSLYKLYVLQYIERQLLQVY